MSDFVFLLRKLNSSCFSSMLQAHNCATAPMRTVYNSLSSNLNSSGLISPLNDHNCATAEAQAVYDSLFSKLNSSGYLSFEMLLIAPLPRRCQIKNCSKVCRTVEGFCPSNACGFFTPTLIRMSDSTIATFFFGISTLRREHVHRNAPHFECPCLLTLPEDIHQSLFSSFPFFSHLQYVHLRGERERRHCCIRVPVLPV